MNSKRNHQPKDKVLVKTFCGTNVAVVLKRRYLASISEHKLGVDGWEAQITSTKDVNTLRKRGVPYKKGEKPIVFVADWQIIKQSKA
jgi:hypothetical protein